MEETGRILYSDEETLIERGHLKDEIEADRS
jgi:hypothetical protein